MDKILLIEDDETMVSLLCTLMQLEGFTATQMGKSETLEKVMENVHTEKPDLILLDVNLRQFNGFDLLHLIRQNDDLKHTRILMSSGMDYRERCLREGADGFILKPYMPEDLISDIKQMIGSNRE
jgi:chemosensory pili system protein ChpA (sensor histidine kinase/response regulator)